MKKDLIKRILLIALLLLDMSVMIGQEYIIRGRVTDEKGIALAGAGVSIVNGLTGVYCGPEGEYALTIGGNGIYSIKFSFTGYETVIREIALPGNQKLDVVLVQKTIMTDEVVVSATRAGTRTPVAYSNISGEELRKKNSVQDLPFLLGLSPSLVETSESGTGIGYTGMRIRGTDGSRINVTLDGIPLNDAESQQVFWVDLPDLAASVDNIQIQRGVGTSANGAGAFGASINIKTKNPENDPYAEINTSAGSFNTYRNMVGAGTGLIKGKFAMQMRYSAISSDGYIRRTSSGNRSAMITGIYKTGNSMLRANVILGEEKTGISWWGVPSEMLAADRRYNPAGEYTDLTGNKQYYDNETDNYRQNHYQLIYSNSPSRNIFLHAALHYTRGEGYYEEYREDQPFDRYGLDDIAIGSLVISKTDLIRRKWMSNHFYGAVYSLSLKRDRLDAVIGGGLNMYEGDHFGRIIWMRHAGNLEKDFQWYFNDSKKGEFSIYGKVNYRLTEKLSGFGDLQFRHISYTMRGFDDDIRDIGQKHKFGFINPKAGLFLSVTPGQDAYLSFSVAGREPTRSDFKEASGDNEATPRAETLFDTELGYNARTDFADFAVNVYGMIYRDQLIPTGELSNVGYPIMTNVERSYRAGIELMAEIRPSDRINLKTNLTLSRNKILNYRGYYIDYNTSDWSSEYRNIDLGTVDIAYSPPVVGSADLSFSVTGTLKVHLITKYAGKQYFDNTMSDSRSIDPYLVNNLMFDFNPRLKQISGVSIRIQLNNILNSLYESNAYGGLWYEDGVEKTWAYYFPQAGFNFMVNLGLRF